MWILQIESWQKIYKFNGRIEKKRTSAPTIEDVEEEEEEGNDQIDVVPSENPEEVNIATQNLDFFEKIFSWQQFTANRNLSHEQKIFLAEKYAEMKQKFVEFCNEKKFVEEGKLVTKEDIELFFTILKETNNSNRKKKVRWNIKSKFSIQ